MVAGRSGHLAPLALQWRWRGAAGSRVGRPAWRLNRRRIVAPLGALRGAAALRRIVAPLGALRGAARLASARGAARGAARGGSLGVGPLGALGSDHTDLSAPASGGSSSTNSDCQRSGSGEARQNFCDNSRCISNRSQQLPGKKFFREPISKTQNQNQFCGWLSRPTFFVEALLCFTFRNAGLEQGSAVCPPQIQVASRRAGQSRKFFPARFARRQSACLPAARAESSAARTASGGSRVKDAAVGGVTDGPSASAKNSEFRSRPALHTFHLPCRTPHSLQWTAPRPLAWCVAAS